MVGEVHDFLLRQGFFTGKGISRGCQNYWHPTKHIKIVLFSRVVPLSSVYSGEILEAEAEVILSCPGSDLVEVRTTCAATPKRLEEVLVSLQRGAEIMDSVFGDQADSRV